MRRDALGELEALDADVRAGSLRGCRGLTTPGPPLRVVYLRSLPRLEREYVLCHELVHVELGLFYEADAPPALVVKTEAIVTARADDDLLPMGELRAWLAGRGDEPTTPGDVAGWFGVAYEVADRQARRVVQRWGI